MRKGGKGGHQAVKVWRGLEWWSNECLQVLGTLVAPPLCTFVTLAVVSAGRGRVLGHGPPQSLGRPCSRQREQHALHPRRARERRARAGQRKQRRSRSQPSSPPVNLLGSCCLPAERVDCLSPWQPHGGGNPIFVFSSFPSFPRVCYFV